MPAKDELAEKIGETYGYVSELIDHKIETVKLSVAEKSATTISQVIMVAVMLVLGGSSALFGLVALAFWLGKVPQTAAGFGIVAGALLLLLLVIFLLRRQIIINPMVTRVIKVFFGDDKQ